MLPEYFGTGNVRSFCRQLYNYRFKSSKLADGSTKFTNPDFARGHCAASKASERNTAHTTTNTDCQLLNQECDQLTRMCAYYYQKAVELRYDTEELIRKNKEMIKQDVTMRINFIDRTRAGLLVFAIDALYYDRETDRKILMYLSRHQYTSPPLSEQEVINIGEVERLGEFVKAHVQNKFSNPNYVTQYLVALLKICCKNLNDRFFSMALDVFYRDVILFVLDREKPSRLLSHQNFGIIANIKETVDDCFRIAYASLLKSGYLEFIESYYKDHPCDFVVEDMETVGDNFDDCFSLRSFKDLLLLEPFDIFSEHRDAEDR